MSRNKIGVPYQNPTRYTGPGTDIIPIIKVSRIPTTTDIRYPLGQQWMIGDSPISGTTGDLWYLAEFISGAAEWKPFRTDSATSGVFKLVGDDAVTIEPDAGGEISFTGVAVANATNAKPLYFDGDAPANNLDAEIQVATEVTGAPGDKNDAGICSFDDTAFSVDADGYVTLAGGAGAAVDSINVDNNTAPGTDPVLATAAGQITIAGAVVAAHSVPVDTHSRAANALNVEVQVGADVTGAPSNKDAAGLVQFDDTGFVVDADGYVVLIGGGGAPVLNMVGDQASGNVPDGSGQITWTGDAVANAAHAKPIYVDDTAASSATIDVQVSAAIAAAPGDKNDAGIASFNSDGFSVDADGYVTNKALGGDPNVIFLDDFEETTIAAPPSQGLFGYLTLGTGAGSKIYAGFFRPGGQAYTYEWYVKFDTSLTPDGVWFFGLGGNPLATATDCVRFEANYTLSNWRATTRASSTSTNTDTGVAFTTNWTKIAIKVNAALTSVTFYIDDVLVATNTTNIFAGSTNNIFQMSKTGAGTTKCFIDYFKVTGTRP